MVSWLGDTCNLTFHLEWYKDLEHHTNGSTKVSQNIATMYHRADVQGVETTDEVWMKQGGEGVNKGYAFCLSHLEYQSPRPL